VTYCYSPFQPPTGGREGKERVTVGGKVTV